MTQRGSAEMAQPRSRLGGRGARSAGRPSGGATSNGRVFDPRLARFLSSDPFIDDAKDSQSYNRYSYVSNSPLNHSDPSGYFKLKDALKIVAVVALSIVTAGAAAAWAGVGAGIFGTGGSLAALAGIGGAQVGFWGAVAAGAGGGFAAGFASTLLNGGSIGDAFKAGVIGAAIGGVSAGLAHGIGTMFDGMGAAKHLAHGVAQGGMAEATGGEFRHGFASGFFSSAAAAPIARTVEGPVAQTVAAAMIGGTASALGGGKFANGAVSGAFTHLFNQIAHQGGSSKSLAEMSSDEIRKRWNAAGQHEIDRDAAVSAIRSGPKGSYGKMQAWVDSMLSARSWRSVNGYKVELIERWRQAGFVSKEQAVAVFTSDEAMGWVVTAFQTPMATDGAAALSATWKVTSPAGIVYGLDRAAQNLLYRPLTKAYFNMDFDEKVLAPSSQCHCSN